MRNVDQVFSTGKVARLSGLPYGTLNYWAKSGFIQPSIAQAEGTGSVRLYDFTDLVALKLAKELRKAGISLQSLREVVRYLRRRGQKKALGDVFLVSDGKEVYERRGGELISTLRRPGQSAWACAIDLGSVVEEVRREVEKVA